MHAGFLLANSASKLAKNGLCLKTSAERATDFVVNLLLVGFLSFCLRFGFSGDGRMRGHSTSPRRSAKRVGINLRSVSQISYLISHIS